MTSDLLSTFISNTLKKRGFTNPIAHVTAGNTLYVSKIATSLNANSVGCIAHLLDLCVRYAFRDYESTWIRLIRDPITLMKRSTSKELETWNEHCRTEHAHDGSLMLLDWNTTQGIFVSLRRFSIRMRDPCCRAYLKPACTQEDWIACTWMTNLLYPLTRLNAAFTQEEIEDIKLETTCPFGAHYRYIFRCIWRFCEASLEIPFDKLPPSHLEGLTNFTHRVLQALRDRFLSNSTSLHRLGYALAIGPILNIGIGVVPTDAKALEKFLEQTDAAADLVAPEFFTEVTEADLELTEATDSAKRLDVSDGATISSSSLMAISSISNDPLQSLRALRPGTEAKEELQSPTKLRYSLRSTRHPPTTHTPPLVPEEICQSRSSASKKRQWSPRARKTPSKSRPSSSCMDLDSSIDDTSSPKKVANPPSKTPNSKAIFPPAPIWTKSQFKAWIRVFMDDILTMWKQWNDKDEQDKLILDHISTQPPSIRPEPNVKSSSTPEPLFHECERYMYEDEKDVVRSKSTRTTSSYDQQLKEFHDVQSHTDRNNDALSWCRTNSSHNAPDIRNAILRLHTISITSAPAENLFSVAELNSDPLPSQLSPHDFETKVIVSYNSPHLSWSQMQGILDTQYNWDHTSKKNKIELAQDRRCLPSSK